MPLGARQAGLSSSETAASLWLKPATHSRGYTKERKHPMKDSRLLDLRWMTGPEFGLSSMKELHPSCCVWAVLLVASQHSCHSQPLALMQTICIPSGLQWTIHVTNDCTQTASRATGPQSNPSPLAWCCHASMVPNFRGMFLAFPAAARCSGELCTPKQRVTFAEVAQVCIHRPSRSRSSTRGRAIVFRGVCVRSLRA